MEEDQATMSGLYKDPIIQKYLDLIKENVGDIRTFYNGTMVQIPISMLPMVMIDIESTEATEFSDAEDEHRVGLVLTFIADMRKDFSAANLIKAGFSKVLEVLVGRDSDYKLKENSILHVLRHNLNIDPDNNLRTDVGSVSVVTPSEVATGRMAGYWSAEGTIRFIAHFIQER